MGNFAGPYNDFNMYQQYQIQQALQQERQSNMMMQPMYPSPSHYPPGYSQYGRRPRMAHDSSMDPLPLAPYQSNSALDISHEQAINRRYSEQADMEYARKHIHATQHRYPKPHLPQQYAGHPSSGQREYMPQYMHNYSDEETRATISARKRINAANIFSGDNLTMSGVQLMRAGNGMTAMLSKVHDEDNDNETISHAYDVSNSLYVENFPDSLSNQHNEENGVENTIGNS
jgi:hypothetical protein